MVATRLQFRVIHLFISTAVVAALCMNVIMYRSLYLTDGAIGIGYTILLSMFYLPAMMGLCFRKTRALAFIVIAAVVAIIGFRQSKLMRQFQLLRSEVVQMAEHVADYHKRVGHYPEKLGQFYSLAPEFYDHIAYFREPTRNSYCIWFNPIADKSYGHYYSPTEGFWFEDD